MKLDEIEITLRGSTGLQTVYIDINDSSLSRKWLAALNSLIQNNNHLEKNYCWFGFADSDRNAQYLCSAINESISAINSADIGYTIDDEFTVENCIIPGPVTGKDGEGGDINHAHLNILHRYFEDLQGVSGNMSHYYTLADSSTRWHIRQLNLLCHELESWILSAKKKIAAPEWQRPSQLMCWLNAPRFELDEHDFELFGIETINRPTGGVFVGVNKAIGKHHWEVFVDEAKYNPDWIADNLITTTLRGQLEAAGDFDIEWANNPGTFDFQRRHLDNFRKWLINNGFDPDDKSLTIGHPQVGQVDLNRSFGTTDYLSIWQQLYTKLDVYKIRTSSAEATYNYHWSDPDYMHQQIKELK